LGIAGIAVAGGRNSALLMKSTTTAQRKRKRERWMNKNISQHTSSSICM
jgi:hypothetical protein